MARLDFIAARVGGYLLPDLLARFPFETFNGTSETYWKASLTYDFTLIRITAPVLDEICFNLVNLQL